MSQEVIATLRTCCRSEGPEASQAKSRISPAGAHHPQGPLRVTGRGWKANIRMGLLGLGRKKVDPSPGIGPSPLGRAECKHYPQGIILEGHREQALVLRISRAKVGSQGERKEVWVRKSRRLNPTGRVPKGNVVGRRCTDLGRRASGP